MALQLMLNWTYEATSEASVDGTVRAGNWTPVDVQLTYAGQGQGEGKEEELEEEYVFDRLSIRVTFIFLYSVVFFFCVVGNFLVLLVVALHWRMRHATQFCLANLAMANFCVGIFCVYQNLSTYLINSWMLGEFLCKMYQFVNALSHMASILTLMVVCVERYLVIIHPFKCHQLMTTKKIRLVIASVWLVSGLYCSPRLYYMVNLRVPLELPNGRMTMEIICTARRTLFNSRTYDMVNSLTLFVFPLIAMSILYFRVGRVLWRSDGLLMRDSTTSPPPLRKRQQKNFSPPPAEDVEMAVRVQKTSPCRNCHFQGSNSLKKTGTELKKETLAYHGHRLRKQISSTENVLVAGKYSGRIPRSRSMTCVPLRNITSDFVGAVPEQSEPFLVPQDDRGSGEETPEISPAALTPPGGASLYCFQFSMRDRSRSGKIRGQNFWWRRRNETEKSQTSPRWNYPWRWDRRTSGGTGKIEILNDPADSSSSLECHRKSYSWRRRRTMNSSCRHDREDKQLKTRQSVVKMLVVIVAVFALCNLPYHFRKFSIYFLPTFDIKGTWGTFVLPLSYWCMYMNCAINPVIYAFMSSQFRTCLKDVLLCRWRKKPYLPRGRAKAPNSA